MSPRLRTLLASLAGLGAAACFAVDVRTGPWWFPVGALCLAAVFAQLPHLGAQLAARGFWWSNFVLGVLFCVFDSGGQRTASFGLTTGAAVALLLAPASALQQAAARAKYRPGLSPVTLQLLMVLAIADAETLGLFAIASSHNRPTPYEAWVYALGALGFLVGFVGLYRLALWGVFASWVTAAAVLTAVLAGFGFDRDLRTALAVLSTLQLAAPLPMLIALVRKRPPRPARVPRAWLSAAAVLTVWSVAMIALARHPHPESLHAPIAVPASEVPH